MAYPKTHCLHHGFSEDKGKKTLHMKVIDIAIPLVEQSIPQWSSLYL